MRYSFSGHESFYCKSLWLKKGYNHLYQNKSFNDKDAVAELGVGKNMVASIRFWLRAFGLTISDKLQPLAHYLFDDIKGRDKFCEDISTLWLLHFMLVQSSVSSIYNLSFKEFQRERKEFDKIQLYSFIKRKCSVPEQKNVYNENTVKKDIAVFLQNYVSPKDLKQIDHFTALLINLDLILDLGHGRYRFAEIETFTIPDEILLFAVYTVMGNEKIMSFDKIQEIALTFCMPINRFLERLTDLHSKHAKILTYTDNSGIRNVTINETISVEQILDSYYDHQ